MAEKKSGVSKRRGAGKVLLATTLAGTAATSAMAQSTTTSAGLMSFLKNTKTKVNNSITNVKEKVLTNALIKTVISAMWPKTVLKKLKGVGEHSWNKFSGNAKYQNKKEIINDKSEKLTVVEEEKNKNNFVEESTEKSNLSTSKKDYGNNKLEPSSQNDKNAIDLNLLKKDNYDLNKSQDNPSKDISINDKRRDANISSIEKNYDNSSNLLKSFLNDKVVNDEKPDVSNKDLNLKNEKIFEKFEEEKNTIDEKAGEILNNKNDGNPDEKLNYEKQSDFSREFDEFDKNSLILSNIINDNVVPPNYEVRKNISANEKNYDVNNINDSKILGNSSNSEGSFNKELDGSSSSKNLTLKSKDDLYKSSSWLENWADDKNGGVIIPEIEKNDEYHGNYHELPDDSFDKKADFNKYYDELDIASEELYDDLDLNLAVENLDLDLKDVLDKMDEDENNSNEKLKENLINENRKKDDLDNKIENHSEKMEGNIKNTEEKNVEDKNDFGSQDTMYKKVKSLVVKSAVGMIGIAGSLLVGSARTFGSWFF